MLQPDICGERSDTWNAITWPRNELKVNKSASNKEPISLVKGSVLYLMQEKTPTAALCCMVSLWMMNRADSEMTAICRCHLQMGQRAGVHKAGARRTNTAAESSLSLPKVQGLLKIATKEQHQCVHLQTKTLIFAGKSACIISFLTLVHKEKLLLPCFPDESNT